MDRKTPQQKKQESYQNDRREGGEYPHADRKNRPRVKARANRKVRRAVAQQMISGKTEILEPPKLRWSNSSRSLAADLENNRRRRVEDQAYNYFRHGYGPKAHDAFRRVVETWMQGRGGQSIEIARFWDRVLHPGDIDVPPAPRVWDCSVGFLHRFFAAEPELLRRFEVWIAERLTAGGG